MTEPVAGWAEWEYALAGLPVPPEVAARAAARRAEQATARAAQASAWPMLHETTDGGQAEPGGTVQLGRAWVALDDVRWDTRGLALVEILADRAGGLANRLLAGCRSLLARRDANVDVYVAAHPDRGTITVYAWSEWGCWKPQRAWWLHTGWDVATDEWGEVRLSPIWGATLAVRGRGVTVFEDDENGPLAEVAARWYLAWEGRRAIRARLGLHQPEAVDEPLTLEQWTKA